MTTDAHVSLARRSLAPAAVSVLSSDPRRVDFLELPCCGLRERERAGDGATWREMATESEREKGRKYGPQAFSVYMCLFCVYVGNLTHYSTVEIIGSFL